MCVCAEAARRSTFSLNAFTVRPRATVDIKDTKGKRFSQLGTMSSPWGAGKCDMDKLAHLPSGDTFGATRLPARQSNPALPNVPYGQARGGGGICHAQVR